MESPQLRPGAIDDGATRPQLLAFFQDAAMGNSAIQLLIGMGIPGDRLGVTPSERIEGGQGMLLAIGCPDQRLLPRVEDACRRLGGAVHRQGRPAEPAVPPR